MEKMEEEANKKVNGNKRNLHLLLLNTIFLAIGACGGPMVMRLYFIHGGKRVWLLSWLQTGGWPINLIPLVITYIHRRHREGSSAAKLVFMGRPMFMAATIIGVVCGFCNYLYGYGIAHLPLSTFTLIAASHLTFTAVFAFVLVKQKFSPYSINAVVMLTTGAGVLALHTSSDRPKGESSKEYYLGFFLALAWAVVGGFVFPFLELSYKKARQAVTYTLVLEIQLVSCFFATVVCTIGMAINNDFKAITREARNFGLGETTYYVVLVASGIVWQICTLGVIGVTFSGSSLLSAMMLAILLPVTEILAVILYKEKFTAEKGVSLALSLWGFVSYFYGELKHNKEKSETLSPKSEMPLPISVTAP